ncbi:hypothetical protein Ae201684P_007777 [Aphanomyces euteiches]|nr:hypothetical protein Ae201684P_007777 [Aphanomyces euteiches]
MPSSRCVHYRGDTRLKVDSIDWTTPRSPLTSPSDAVDTLWATSVAVVESASCVRRPLKRFVCPSDAVDALRVTHTASHHPSFLSVLCRIQRCVLGTSDQDSSPKQLGRDSFVAFPCRP